MIKINKTLIVGYLIKEPELRNSVCSFTLAIKRNYPNKTGEYETDFIKCVAFKQLAGVVSEYCRKGDLIGVEGRITTSKYEKDGKTVYNTEITADNVRFISKKGNTTPKQEKAVEQPKNESKLSDDIFADFGKQIEIDDDMAF